MNNPNQIQFTTRLTISRTVRVFTSEEALKNHDFIEMPIEELPSGFLRAHLKHLGEFYLNPAWLKDPPEPRHPAFPEEVVAILRRQLDSGIGEGMKMDLEQWEYGFRLDAHPWGEIAHWERTAEACRRFAAHLTVQDEFTRQKRLDLFRVISFLATDVSIGACGSVTAKRAKEIADWMYADERSEERKLFTRHVRKLLQPDGVAGPNQIPIDALFNTDGTGPNLDADFNPMDVLDEAEVIIALDVDTGNRRVAYGKETVKRIATTDEGKHMRVLTVVIDEDTDELEKLAALVKVVKGRHDFD